MFATGTKERRAETARLRRKANPERARAAERRWRETHTEAVRAKSLRRKAEHPGESTASWARWQRSHPEAVRTVHGRRPNGPSLRWLLYKRPDLLPICAIGGGEATQADHLWPVSLGGPNKDLKNLRPICTRHNLMRGPARKTDRQLQEVPCS